nr:MAG TPA: hypothetical protein [Caudoviricetes sp.]
MFLERFRKNTFRQIAQKSCLTNYLDMSIYLLRNTHLYTYSQKLSNEFYLYLAN